MDKDALLEWLRLKALQQHTAAHALGPQHGKNCEEAANALNAAADLIEATEYKLDLANQQALAERDKYDAELVRVDELQSRLDAAEKENAFSRKWIRELRERIEGLMSGDPPAESADGIRLIALADVCEAYEKGVVEKPVSNSRAHLAARGFECGHNIEGPLLADMPTICPVCFSAQFDGRETTWHIVE